jgi:hypothetical protein
VPSPINSTILPPIPEGESPTKRSPLTSRATGIGIDKVIVPVDTGALTPVLGLRARIRLLFVSAMKTVPFLETAMFCGCLYPDPIVCWASTTMDGACAHPAEAQMARLRTGKKSDFRFEVKSFAGNLDDLTNMGTALL